MSGSVKRLLALGVAVVMILSSLAIRNFFDDSDSSSGRNDGVAFRLTCATELRDVCTSAFGQNEEIVVKFEDPGRTTDSLVKTPAGRDPGFDGWLTAGPWSEILADNRRFGPQKGELLGEDSDVLGRSPVVIVAVSQAAGTKVEQVCGNAATWACLVDHVQGTQGGSIRLGLPSPDRGDGLAVVSSAVNSLFGSSDYSSSDLEQGAFGPYFEDLTKLSKTVRLGGRTVLKTALSTRGTFDVVGTLEAETATLVNPRADLSITYPEPPVTADVRLSTRKGLKVNEALKKLDTKRLAQVLAANGWRVDGEVSVKGVNNAQDLPATSNMPSPGVLQRLRDEWDG